VDLAVIAQQLKIQRALVEDETFDDATVRSRELRPQRLGPGTRPQRAQVANQLAGFCARQVRKCRHAGGRQPLFEE
jgi:hypothetical protein